MLNLVGNQLTSVPKELGQLKNLKYMSLYNNKLRSIPKELGNLTNMNELLLSENQLTSVPKELGKLTKLETLTLEGNPLESPSPEVSLAQPASVRMRTAAAPAAARKKVRERIAGNLAQPPKRNQDLSRTKKAHAKAAVLPQIPVAAQPSPLAAEAHPAPIPTRGIARWTAPAATPLREPARTRENAR